MLLVFIVPHPAFWDKYLCPKNGVSTKIPCPVCGDAAQMQCPIIVILRKESVHFIGYNLTEDKNHATLDTYIHTYIHGIILPAFGGIKYINTAHS